MASRSWEQFVTEAHNEAVTANRVIALKRDADGQGRIKVATAMHRIERLLSEALALARNTPVSDQGGGK